MRLHLDVLGASLVLEAHRPPGLERLVKIWSACLVDDAAAEPATVVNNASGDSNSTLGLLIDVALSPPPVAGELRLLGCAVVDSHDLATVFLGPPPNVQADVVLGVCAAGNRYLASSVVRLDTNGAVLPDPLPLVVAEAGRDVVLRGPAELGIPIATAPATLVRVVIADPGTPDGEFVVCDPTEAVIRIPYHLRGPEAHDQVLQRVLTVLDRGVEVFRTGARSPQVLGDSLALGNGHPRSGEWMVTWSALPPDPRPAGTVTWALMDGRVRQTPYRDAVRIGDGAAVLARGPATRLSPVGTTIWELAAGAPTPEELVEGVVAAHDPHPQAEELVGEAVLNMVSTGVLGYALPEPIEPYLTALQVRLAGRRGSSSDP